MRSVLLFVAMGLVDRSSCITVVKRKRRLFSVLEHQDAIPLLTTLRSVITDIFAEAHDEDQHLAILHRIRERIQMVLPDFNGCHEAIEVEPIAGQSPATGAGDDPKDGENEPG